ncbi:MAG: hypothetical protein V2J62_04945 [candidate division KSB1 bacterium]|nr:hypothetical protein [candidate division KSB1 bacterium]
MKFVSVVFSVLVLAFVLQASAVFADTAPDNADDQNKAMKVFLNKIEIYGRIAKPQTVFIIPGTDPRVDGIDIERRFFNDIFRTVEKSTLRKEWIREQRKDDHILW